MISTLSDLIAQVESTGNPWAVRFEPAHNPAASFVSRMAAVARCSTDTARVLCASSWGLFQIMGDELMALGLNMSPIQYCASAQTQQATLPRFLAEKGLSAVTLDAVINDTPTRLNFATKYNGPGNVQVYSQRLLDVYHAAK